MNTIKAILFDFDGVMTLDKTGTQSTCDYISKNYCIDKNVFEKEYRKYNYDLLCGRTTHEKIWNILCSNLDENIPVSILHDSFVNTPIDMAMVDLVKSIKESNVKTALITDNKIDRIKAISEKYELPKIFDIIVISAEVGSGKENDGIFNKALSELKCEPNECIFIDNQEKNLTIPRNMGINTIYYDDEKRDIDQLKMEIGKYGIKI